ncbi:hypothetical protein NSP_27680 [Nodularia spumigena CCY9414]|nr:hypothetical protein NSP_27680 [Nodularia spumigena CCY9414]
MALALAKAKALVVSLLIPATTEQTPITVAVRRYVKTWER